MASNIDTIELRTIRRSARAKSAPDLTTLASPARTPANEGNKASASSQSAPALIDSTPNQQEVRRANDAGTAECETAQASSTSRQPKEREPLLDRLRRTFPGAKSDDFFTIISRDRKASMNLTFRGEGRSFMWLSNTSREDLEWAIRLSEQLPTVIVIEDVNLECLEALDRRFGLDPDFLMAYVSDHSVHSSLPTADTPDMVGQWYLRDFILKIDQRRWTLREPSDQGRDARPKSKLRYSDFIPRRFREEREVEHTPWWQEKTRQYTWDSSSSLFISRTACYGLAKNLLLVLVESSPHVVSISKDALPTGEILGSIYFQLPVSFSRWDSGHTFSVLDAFEALLTSSHDTDAVEASDVNASLLGIYGPIEVGKTKKLFDSYTILWPLVSHAWTNNLKFLRSRLAAHRSNAVSRPTMDTYLPLIRLRQRIVGMRDALSRAIVDSSFFVERYNAIFPSSDTPTASIQLTQKLEQVQVDLDKLDRELNDEIHLVIGAVTVQDSSANKLQTEQATLLTLLAAVYLPLTLVSGIFGMNIAQITDTTFRDCLATLAVVAFGTVCFVLAYVYWRRWRRECERREMEEQHLKDV